LAWNMGATGRTVSWWLMAKQSAIASAKECSTNGAVASRWTPLEKPVVPEVKHMGGAVVFIELGILEIVIGFGEVVAHSSKNPGGISTTAVGHNDHLLEGHVLHGIFGTQEGGRHRGVRKAILSMSGDASNLVRMKVADSGVCRMPPADGNTKERLQVSRVIPHHGSQTRIAGL